MGAGARADSLADSGADARRVGSELALTPPPHTRRAVVARIACLAWFALALGGALAQEPQPADYVWRLPRGFPTPAVPADNPMSEAKVALGRRLFFERRLSVTGRSSCASCHDPARSFSDGRAVA